MKLQSLTPGGSVVNTTFKVDSPVYQTIGVGSTAVGYVASWDSATAVLKIYNPVGLGSTAYGFRLNDFTSQIGVGGSYAVNGQSAGGTLGIDTSFPMINEAKRLFPNKKFTTGSKRIKNF